MRGSVLFWVVFLAGYTLLAQQIDPSIARLRERMDSISSFRATVRMEVDISFVNMPVKQAEVVYRKGAPLQVHSEDFVMIPKRGLDLTLEELYRHPFMTLNLGKVSLGGRQCEQIKVIPTTEASDYAIATLWLDTETLRVLKTRISTEKNGVFDIVYAYGGKEPRLPSEIEVRFEVSDLRIPLRFLGRDTEIDRKGMKTDAVQQGAIRLQLSDVQLTLE